MISFDRLILRPAMGAFARPVAIIPADGQRAPYLARGDFRRPTQDIQLDDGEMTTAAPTLGIRRSEFPALPVQKDQVYVDVVVDSGAPGGFRLTPETRRYRIMDVRPDGEGDIKLVLAAVSSP